jgi:hypothetical protein
MGLIKLYFLGGSTWFATSFINCLHSLNNNDPYLDNIFAQTLFGIVGVFGIMFGASIPSVSSFNCYNKFMPHVCVVANIKSLKGVVSTTPLKVKNVLCMHLL